MRCVPALLSFVVGCVQATHLVATGNDGDRSAIVKQIWKKSNGDVWQVWETSLVDSASFISKLASGQSISKQDKIDMGMDVLGAAAKDILGANPMIGVAMGFFQAVFSVFGKQKSEEQKILEDIMKILPEKIDKEIYKQKLEDENHLIGGFLDAHNLGRDDDSALVTNLIRNQEVIYGNCWDKGTSDSSCQAWLQAGAFVLQYSFSSLTLNSMVTEILNVNELQTNSNNTFDFTNNLSSLISEYKYQQGQYLKKLDASRAYLKSWRNKALTSAAKKSCTTSRDLPGLHGPTDPGRCSVVCDVENGQDSLEPLKYPSYIHTELAGYGCTGLDSEIDSWWAKQNSMWQDHYSAVQDKIKSQQNMVDQIRKLAWKKSVVMV